MTYVEREETLYDRRKKKRRRPLMLLISISKRRGKLSFSLLFQTVMHFMHACTYSTGSTTTIYYKRDSSAKNELTIDYI